MYRYRIFLRRYRQPLIVVAAIVFVLGLLALIIVWLSYHARPKVTDFNSCVDAGYDASDSDPQTCSDGHHTYVSMASSAPSTVSRPAQTVQSYQVLVSGDTHGTYPAKQQTVTSQAAWASLWSQLYAKTKPFPPLLPVDFTTNQVVVLTQGVEPSSGYGIEVTGVATSTNGMSVSYNSITPQGSCGGGPSDPIEIIVTAKAPGPIDYESTPKSHKC